MLGNIYIIKNLINNKIYIGQTINSIERRWDNHKSASKKEDTKFYRAIRKYGENNFSISLLEKVEIEKLNEREQYWIKFFNSYEEGYNSTIGGEGTRTIDYEIIKKLWDEGLSIIEIHYKTEYSRDSISVILKQVFQVDEVEIKQRSNKKKNSLSSEFVIECWNFNMTVNQIKEKYGSTNKTIIQILLDNNISQEEINSRTLEHKKDSQRKHTNEEILKYWNEGKCIREIYRSYGGNIATIRKQLEEVGISKEEIEQRSKTKVNQNAKKVVQFNKNYDIVKIYSSAAEASRETGIASSSIGACCNHKPKYKSAGGFLWEFYENIKKYGMNERLG